MRTCIPLIAAFAAMLLGGTLGADELSYYEKTLTEKNIITDSDGLNEYLSDLHPNEQQRQRAIQLIEALGSTDSFAKRVFALAFLLAGQVVDPIELHDFLIKVAVFFGEAAEFGIFLLQPRKELRLRFVHISPPFFWK